MVSGYLGLWGLWDSGQPEMMGVGELEATAGLGMTWDLSPLCRLLGSTSKDMDGRGLS